MYSKIPVLSILFALLFFNISSAQDTSALVNSLPEKIDPLDINLLTTKKTLEKKVKLNEKKFSDGYIIQGKDTIQCKIYTGKELFNPSLFVLFKDSTSLRIVTPYHIKQFMVNGSRFIRHFSNTNNFNNLFFIKELEKGKINLYGKPGIPSDPYYTYYLSKDNNRTFYILNPETRTVAINEERQMKDAQLRGYNDNIMYYNSTNLNEQFENAMMNFIKDCTMVRNKIKHEVYTVTDIERIIMDYNNCAD